ncbi:MAG TPA: SDR family oxidoreductase [Ignavibacteria bacterium]|nr:SDR family oxidoreductase [Ignavibacteria bacterium]
MNKIALITGGVRRLGKDISISLSEIGYDLIVTYNKSSKADIDSFKKAVKTKVDLVKSDVSKVSDIKKLFKHINKNYKSLNLLVNNAGIFRHYDFFEITEKDFDDFINTNLKGTFFCAQFGAEFMLKTKSENPQIINLASLGGIQNWTGYIPYSVSKAGVIKLTQQLAKRLAPDILVNSISPGTIVIENDKNETVNFNEMKKYPVKKFGEARDITSLINFLATENKFITGHNFIVDGGKTL